MTEKHRYTIRVVFEKGRSRLRWRYHVAQVTQRTPARDVVRAVESGGASGKFRALLQAHLAAWTAARDLRREAKPYTREVKW